MGAAASSADSIKQEGNAAFGQGDHVTAVKLYTQAIGLSPADYKLYSNRSAAQTGLGQYTRALADAAVVMALKPSWAKVRNPVVCAWV